MAQPAPAPLRLGFLASHAGTTLAHVLDACASGALAAEARIVISNNSGAGALAIARERGVPARHISALSEGSAQAEQRAIARHLVGAGCELVVLAGYMKRLGSAVLDAFPDRLVNVHPAVLPDFGGRGMFGGRVHQAVIDAGVATSGATVHLVDAGYDTGGVLARCTVPVLAGDDATALEARVRAAEKALLVGTLARIAEGRLLSLRPAPAPR